MKDAALLAQFAAMACKRPEVKTEAEPPLDVGAEKAKWARLTYGARAKPRVVVTLDDSSESDAPLVRPSAFARMSMGNDAPMGEEHSPRNTLVDSSESERSSGDGALQSKLSSMLEDAQVPSPEPSSAAADPYQMGGEVASADAGDVAFMVEIDAVRETPGLLSSDSATALAEAVASSDGSAIDKLIQQAFQSTAPAAGQPMRGSAASTAGHLKIKKQRTKTKNKR